jgi:hypothetical protein
MTRLRVEELMREAYAETFGGIFNKVRDALSDELATRLSVAVERRNYLAHHFWFEQAYMLTSAEGAHALVEQLAETVAEFEQINAQIERVTRADLRRIGITDATFDQWFAEVSRVPMEPLPTQRRLKKEEIVIAVYELPVSEGGIRLIFETDDHVLWELCDVGLGWSRHREIGRDWRVAERFRDLLPARVRPRPESTTPWEYEIPFGPKATLVVGLAPDKKKFVYRLKRKVRPPRP